MGLLYGCKKKGKKDMEQIYENKYVNVYKNNNSVFLIKKNPAIKDSIIDKFNNQDEVLQKILKSC